MSYYEDERRRARPTRERSRRDSYDDESAYTARDAPKAGSLVKRRDSYDSVDDEVTRDFPPPDGRGGYIRETTIRKSGTRPARARSYDDDDDDRYYDARDDRSYHHDRRGARSAHDRRDRQSRRYSSDYSSRSRSRTPPRREKERRKSKPEEALEALGLGGLAATLLGKKEHDRERSRSRDGRDRAYSEDRSSTRRRSRSRGPAKREQMSQVLKAAALAAAGEAFRARKEPGGWTGEKGKRVLTAAISAGGLDGFIQHGKDSEKHGTRDALGSAIAGIATSRIVNGPRSKSRGRDRTGSPDARAGRSQSRGGFGDLVAGGTLAAAAKKAYDSVRSRSRGRDRSRSPSDRSDVSRSPERPSRRRSLSRAAARGLSAVGLNSAADKLDPPTPRNRRRGSDDYDSRSRGRYDDEYRDDDVRQSRGPINGRARSVSQNRSDWHVAERSHTPSAYALDFGPRHNGDPDTDSDSDLGSSSGEEKERKKGKRKQILTTGLATVATIHAGHSVYQSYEKRHARKQAVRAGKITAEEAKKNRNRDRLQDAASIGLAALGIKGAYSEWKETNEVRTEMQEEREKLARHKAKRDARRQKYAALERQGYSDSGYASSMPNLHSPPPMSAPPMGGYPPYVDQHGPYYDGHGPYSAAPMSQHGAGVHYYDDNPYSGYQASPPPPAATPSDQARPRLGPYDSSQSLPTAPTQPQQRPPG